MTVYEILPDGSVCILHEGQMGIVSSWHLVEPKLAQLQRTARRHDAAPTAHDLRCDQP
jgi:hypothetical protein